MAKSSQINHVKELDELKVDHSRDDIAAWIGENGKYILYGISGLLLALIVAMQFISQSRSSAESEYLTASVQFERLQQGKDSDEALKTLEGIIANHPELQSKYDGPIGQALLGQNNESAAQPYVTRTLERVKASSLDLHHNYAQTSLLISEKRYKEALEKAEALKQQLAQMDGLNTQYQTLYAFNLLRIAFLHQALGDKAQEKLAWNDVKMATQGAANEQVRLTDLPPAFKKHLQAGKFSLEDYINERESVL